MKKYSKYKKTDIDGVNELPENWRTIKLAYFGVFDKGRGISKSQLSTDGDKVILYGDIYTKYNLQTKDPIRKAPKNVTKGSTPIHCGDLLFTGSGETREEIGKTIVYLGEEQAYAGGDVIIFRQNKYNSLFLSYLLNSYPYEYQKSKMGKGEIVVHIYSSQLRDVKAILPTIKEQTDIATYLDHKTALIDKLIASNEKQIKLLEEKRKATINQAVTKGLDPNVKMKDSGVEWIGEIPEHWEVKKLKWVLESEDSRRIPLSSSQRGTMEYKQYPYYGASGIIDYVEDYIFEEPMILFGEDGANLLNRTKRLAFIADGKYWVNNHAHILRPKTGNDIRYICEQLELNDVSTIVSGSAQPKLTQDNLSNIKLIVPPVREQEEIATFLDTEITQTERLEKKIKKQNKLLKEYRQSLISHVVTGKVDVRDEVKILEKRND
jgi:type I restriction enzyme S subunit